MAQKWFTDNFMNINADKCHLVVLGKRCNDSVTVKIGNTDLVNSSEEKLLGVHIDSKWTFDYPNMDHNKLKNLMRAFISS